MTLTINLAPESMRFAGHARGRHVVDRITSHESAVATLQGTVKALQAKALSVHYSVDRDGSVMQHCGVEHYTAHAGIPGQTTGHNTRSIGIEFINRYYGHRVGQTKGLALYSGTYAPDIITGIWVDRAWSAAEKRFLNAERAYIMPTLVQLEAGWQLMEKLLELFPNVKKAGWSGVTKTLLRKPVYNWQPVRGHDSPGVKCHAQWAHADGRVPDHFMLLRSYGWSPEAAFTKTREDASSHKRQTPLPIIF
jgi:hypothetical protein